MDTLHTTAATIRRARAKAHHARATLAQAETPKARHRHQRRASYAARLEREAEWTADALADYLPA